MRHRLHLMGLVGGAKSHVTGGPLRKQTVQKRNDRIL